MDNFFISKSQLSDELIWISIVVVIVIAIRFFGAWMLRIDEVIKELKLLRKEIKEHNDKIFPKY